MYEIFEKLLQERGITPCRVSKATGIASSTLSEWKNGVSTPKADKLQKIADYFGVTLDYLTCFRVYLEVIVFKNPTCFSRWSVRSGMVITNAIFFQDILNTMIRTEV